MACIPLDEKTAEIMGRLLAKWDARRRCKVRMVRKSHDEFVVEQGNERLGTSAHGTLVRTSGRWRVQVDEPDLDERINGADGFARRGEAKHALLWFWKEGTTYRDGKIIPWVDRAR